MSYSRWITSEWYTFWAGCSYSEEKENRDNAQFCVCGDGTFSAKELREDMQGCLEKIRVKTEASEKSLQELAGYMQEFLEDVDRAYPEVKSEG